VATGPACAWLGWRVGGCPGSDHYARVFAGVPAEVQEARAFVGRVLAGCPARETLVTCVSEFCANAIEHTASGVGGVFSVEVARPADGFAYVAVTDEGGAGAPTVLAPEEAQWADELSEGGRGLAMVEACSSRWGYQRASGSGPGRTVWAEVTWPVPAGAGR